MKKYICIPLYLMLIILALTLVGCDSNAETTAQMTLGEPEFLETAPTAVMDEDLVVLESEPQEPIDQSDEVEAVVEAVTEENYCINCHTDQQTLIDTAKPEEEITSENEGEG